MDLFRCYTVSKDVVQEGIDASDFSGVLDPEKSVTKYAAILSYPLYPSDQTSGTLPDLFPLSLCFVKGQKTLTKNDTLNPCGIILAVKPGQWLPAAASLDKSCLLDAGSEDGVLLYCPVGSTMLKANSRQNKYLTVSDKLGVCFKEDLGAGHLVTGALGTGFRIPSIQINPSFQSPLRAEASKLSVKRAKKRKLDTSLPDIPKARKRS